MTERGVTMAQACRDLELAESVLRRWMREATVAPATAFPLRVKPRSGFEVDVLLVSGRKATDHSPPPANCSALTARGGELLPSDSAFARMFSSGFGPFPTVG